MANYTQNLGNTINFTSALVVCDPPGQLLLDFGDDYLIFDTQVSVDYTQPSRELGRDGKVNESGPTVHLCHVGRYVINTRDLLNGSNGHLKVGDIRAEISDRELSPLKPKLGDKLNFSDGAYYALATDYDPMTKMHIVWCRK